MTTTAEFTNAQEMHRLHADTFDAPTPAELAGIAPGDLVKVCVGGERFWVKVMEAAEGTLAGMVDNILLFSDQHGLSYGDPVTFGRECVYDLIRSEDRQAAGGE
jgi:hypothetical protein